MRVCLFAAFVLVSSNCIITDCGFRYHAAGKLVDARTGQPEVGVKLALGVPPLEPSGESPNWPGFLYTDSAGRFEHDFGTGITWGYWAFLGVIPIGSRKGPIPPELKELSLAFQTAGGDWRKQTIVLTSDQQQRVAPAERWIDLGTVTPADSGR
jgi:hypothetical protein